MLYNNNVRQNNITKQENKMEKNITEIIKTGFNGKINLVKNTRPWGKMEVFYSWDYISGGQWKSFETLEEALKNWV